MLTMSEALQQQLSNEEPASRNGESVALFLCTDELLRDVFSLVQDVEKGTLARKDFDNTAGGLRLKLADSKRRLQEIEGIIESLEDREDRIKVIQQSNSDKLKFLAQFRDRVRRDLASEPK